MSHWVHFVSLLLSLILSGVCQGQGENCVPEDATTAEVRALPGLPGSGVVDAFAFIDGVPIVLVEGNAYAQLANTCEWILVQEVYDPAYFEDTFFMQDGQWYRRLDSGESLLLSTEFADDFEFGSRVQDLLLPDGSRYTSFVLLSPLAPSVPEYNALRDCLMAGTCDFLDNRIDFDPTVARTGEQSLRFYAVPPSPESQTSKSMVERGLFFFRQDDHAWFSGWYKVEEALPFTLLDFETSGITLRPGLRITLRSGALSAELKWLDKPQYLQEPGSVVPFPIGRWVHVRVHVLFSEDEFGKIEIWQDGIKILSQHGRTLPTADAVIDFVQIGITATPRETVLHVDDVQVSATRIPGNPNGKLKTAAPKP